MRRGWPARVAALAVPRAYRPGPGPLHAARPEVWPECRTARSPTIIAWKRPRGPVPLDQYVEPTALSFGYVFGLMARLPGWRPPGRFVDARPAPGRGDHRLRLRG